MSGMIHAGYVFPESFSRASHSDASSGGNIGRRWDTSRIERDGPGYDVSKAENGVDIKIRHWCSGDERLGDMGHRVRINRSKESPTMDRT